MNFEYITPPFTESYLVSTSFYCFRLFRIWKTTH